MRSSIGLHALDSNMIRRHDAANTVKPDERRPREQRKGWPSAEKNDENERVRENTGEAGRGACTSSSGYSQLPLAHRRRLSYLPGMRAQHMEHESPQVESHCQTMSIHEYLIMSGHRNTATVSTSSAH